MTRATPPPSEGNTGPDAAILQTTGLRLGYGSHAVLDQVNLDIRSGEFWFLVGPNGHGKTTLLLAILGRLRPAAGRLVRRGDFARPDRVGFVPQDCSITPTLPTTVQEFVGLGLVGIRAGRAERADRLSWALDQVGLGGMQTRDFWSLSGGQRQRALVARALIRRPRVLVGDEPTAGLDLSVEAALYESLSALNRSGHLTLILVTHDVATAARYGTHLALVHDGRVLAGSAAQVLHSGGLERAYGIPIEVSSEAPGSVSLRLGSAQKSRCVPEYPCE
jgi:ABC-type Mn2+/Zn2+ transport system ATPase subunit